MTPGELGWTDFNVAMAGATAALAGLVIVASSVNIDKIVGARTITSRLAAGIAALLLALVACGVSLIPGATLLVVGVVMLVAAGLTGVFALHATAVIVRDPSPAARARLGKSLLVWAPVLAYAVAGILGIAGLEASLVVAAVGAMVAIVAAVVISWVALVEVLR